MVEVKDSESTEAPDEPKTTRSGWRRWVFRGVFYLFSLLAGGGLCVLTMWYLGGVNRSSDESATVPPPISPLPAAQVSEALLTPEEGLQQADIRFMSGNYLAAEDAYRELLGGADPVRQFEVRYRLGLCAEKLNRTEEALSQYVQILDADNSSEDARRAAGLGKARAWQQAGRFEPARALLMANLLSANRAGVVAHSLHALSQLLTLEIQPLSSSVFDDQVVLTELIARNDEYHLQLLKPSNEVLGSIPEGVKVLDRFSTHPRDMQVSVYRSCSITELLTEIQSATAVSFDTEPEVDAVLNLRTVTVVVAELNLATLLDALLEPAGLIWLEQQGQILVRRVDRLSADVVRRHRIEQTLRLCRTALAMYPDHRLATSTLLCLGNVYFWRGQYDDALSPFKELERRVDGSESMSTVWFNQAKTRLQMNQITDAREAFFRVVDLARGKSIQSVAYIYLGRLFLEGLEVDEGNRHLARGLSRARDDESRGIGAITLAAGYLMADNPVAANQTLLDHRGKLRQEPYESSAVFLSALARFRATLEPRDRLRRGHELTSSLSAVEPERFFCAAGPLLIGAAYGEIGLPRQRLAVFQRAIEHTRPCDLRKKLVLTVATDLIDAGQIEMGSDHYRQLADGSGTRWDFLARFELAGLAYKESDDDACLARCYELLSAAESTVDKARVLKLMGRVYQRRADHYKAALCFAGMVPTVKKDALSSTSLD